MIGFVRCEARYAVPMSRMNRPGECVSRPVPRLFVPEWASVPPTTSTRGATRLTASYARASRRS